MSSILEETSKYLIGGFTLIPALAWNDLIRGFFERVAPSPIYGSLLFKIIYVIVISILAWFGVEIIAKIFS